MKLPLTKFYNYRYDDSYEAFMPNKTILLVALKGAYIDCTRLINIDKKYTKLKNVYDDVYTICVNDSYVVNSWANELDIKNITVLPDGNGSFTESIGALTYSDALGFRSKYYSCIVYDYNIVSYNENINLF